MNEEQIGRLVRAAWNFQPPDDLEYIIDQAKRRRAEARRAGPPGIQTVASWLNRTLVGTDGAALGRIVEVYLDDRTNEPAWVLVASVARLGNLVPISDAVECGNHIQVPFHSSVMVSAPGMGPGGALSEQEEADLYHHYGLHYVPRPREGEFQSRSVPWA